MSAVLVLVDLAGWCAALVLIALAVRHLALAMRHGPVAAALLAAPPEPIEGADLPDILVQLPVFNEARSVTDALAAAAALDWPNARMTIQLLDDSTDETSLIAGAEILRLQARGFTVEHVRRGRRDGYKAGALAAGLERSDAEFVAILDADHRASPDWLRRAVGVLVGDPAAAFVQFRFEFANRDANTMTRVQQMTVDSHFVVEQAGRMAAGEPFQFNGTAGVWRRAAIEDAGGWSSDTLAEDLDLSLRAYLRGWRSRLVLAGPVRCEAPADLRSWRVQQQRWSRGFVQVAVKMLPRVWRAPLPLRAKLAATGLLCLQAALPSALVAAAALAADIALRGGIGNGHVAIMMGAATACAGTAVAITWPAHRALRRGGPIRYATTLASLPPLLAYLAAANSAAILRAPFGGGTDFVRTPKAGI